MDYFSDYFETYGPDPVTDTLADVAGELRAQRNQRANEWAESEIARLKAGIAEDYAARADQFVAAEFDRLGIPAHERAEVGRRAAAELQRTGTFDLQAAYNEYAFDQRERVIEETSDAIVSLEREIGRKLTDSEAQRAVSEAWRAADETGIPINVAVTNAHLENNPTVDLGNAHQRGAYAAERMLDIERQKEETAAEEVPLSLSADHEERVAYGTARLLGQIPSEDTTDEH
jgi:hypothetical protein